MPCVQRTARTTTAWRRSNASTTRTTPSTSTTTSFPRSPTPRAAISSTVCRPRRWLDRPTVADGVPARRERGRVEALGGGERPVGALLHLTPEHSAQYPLARQPNKVELVVAQKKLALRMEVEVDRHLLDQRRIGWFTRLLLDPVRHQRGQHLDLAHARADGNSDR